MSRDPRLSLNARQQELLDWVQRDGFVTVDDLASHFAVTPQTIRRDVNWLSDMNLLRRYHGGASLPTTGRRARTAHARSAARFDAKTTSSAAHRASVTQKIHA